MIIFYAPDSDGDWVELPVEEARHCVQVLRHKVGDTIHWVDGKGTFFAGELIEAGKRSCRVTISQRTENYGKRPFRVHLAIAPTKQIDRMEWFLEKATEIGIEEITLLRCAHSERRQVRLDRLNKVLISAMKQSLKAYLPELRDITPFSTFIESFNRNEQRMIAHMGANEDQHLLDLYESGGDVCLLIGPEGGFHPQEIALAQSKGFQSISLGSSRLRAETAAVVACTLVTAVSQSNRGGE